MLHFYKWEKHCVILPILTIQIFIRVMKYPHSGRNRCRSMQDGPTDIYVAAGFSSGQAMIYQNQNWPSVWKGECGTWGAEYRKRPAETAFSVFCWPDGQRRLIVPPVASMSPSRSPAMVIVPPAVMMWSVLPVTATVHPLQSRDLMSPVTVTVIFIDRFCNIAAKNRHYTQLAIFLIGVIPSKTIVSLVVVD